jgi:DNA-directed RNA polymerase subunit beta
VERHEWWKFAADDVRQQQLEATKGQYDNRDQGDPGEVRGPRAERGDELLRAC